MTKVLSATWQRCRVHLMRNMLAHAGKSGRRVISAFSGDGIGYIECMYFSCPEGKQYRKRASE